jgi:hypothetical protein
MANLVLVAQAVAASEYSDVHIRFLLREGLVKGEKVGGIWLVDLDDLKRYEQEMEDLGQRKFDPTRGDPEV